MTDVAPGSAEPESLDKLIWATRGRSWGFRFLLSGGLSDPLLNYERAFDGLEGEPAAYRRTDAGVALRIPDPEGRKDAAGREIPHEFVVFGDLAHRIASVHDGLQHVWPLVAAAYDEVWGAESPISFSFPWLNT